MTLTPNGSPNRWAERIGRTWETSQDVRRFETIGSGRAARPTPSPDQVLRRRARSDEEFDTARETLDRIGRGDDLQERHMISLEAIIEPETRPVIDVVDDTYTDIPWNWTQLGDEGVRESLTAVARAVGRVEIPNHPSIPYGGTAFMVGNGLMMTNRHVAELFTDGLGLDVLTFKRGLTSEVDLKQEVVATGDLPRLTVEQVLMIHPYWDCAILKVTGEALADRTPLKLVDREPTDIRDREVAIIGYPAFDRRNDVALQQRIFRVFEKKRLQPGLLRGYDYCESYGIEVEALTHDISTLGGNSGSAVVDLHTGEVLGLHFAGVKRRANYAVPAWQLARDVRVVDTGINFVAPPSASLATPWEEQWREADPGWKRQTAIS